jgi:hypothetical protein
MDEPSGGTLRFSGHWILTNVFVTQTNILTFDSSIFTSVKTSPDNKTLPYLFSLFLSPIAEQGLPSPKGLDKIEKISQLRQVT